MIKSKKAMFKALLSDLSSKQSRSGCNDFTVANTPKMYKLFEESAARNLRCASVEEFRKHPQYKDYKPNVSKDGKEILTQDFIALEIMRNELGCNEK